MAQGLRARQLTFSLPIALLLGCEGEQQQESVQELSPAEIVDAVLQHCHGSLRGGMDRVILDLREEEDKLQEIALWLPDQMRIDAGGIVDTLQGEIAWRCLPGEPPVVLTGEALSSLVEMKELLRGLLLIPLYQMRSVRQEGAELILELEGGEDWSLVLREESLLPASLRGLVGEIRFLEYRESSVNWLPRRVALGDLGEREVQFRAADIRYNQLLFADPETRLDADLPRGKPGDPPRITVTSDYRPATPEPMQIPAAFWLVIEDPGDWEPRHNWVAGSQSELFDQGQTLKGFTGFVEENDRPFLVMPFAPDPNRGSRPFVRTGKQIVRRVPAHRALVVYPPRGAFMDVVARGSEMLRAYVEANNLQADGPLRKYPYLFIDEGLPTADDLASVVVRLELPIR